MRTFPAVLVTGPRQTGKTTLLREEFGDSHRYVSLERPDVRDVARDDPVGFLADAGERVILDEIQYAPELLHYIKDDIDAHRRQPGRWLLTGSQDFALMRGVSQTLAGRIAVLHLDPLAVSEVLGAAAPTSLGDLLENLCTGPGGDIPELDLADWLHRGAWPEPRLNPEVDRDLWMQSYVQTYLERDLRNMEQVSNLETFRAFFSLVCASTGQVLNLARLGRDVGVSAPTARRWLNLLVTSRLDHHVARPSPRKVIIRGMRKLLVSVALMIAVVVLQTPRAAAQDDGVEEAERITRAAAVLDAIMAADDSAIPNAILERAQGIAVFPGTTRAGFGFGGMRGRGVLSARSGDSWSAPAFLTLTGGSFGLQIGVQRSDIILVIMVPEGLDNLVSNQFSIGVDAGLAAGPVGRNAAAATDIELSAQILSYSRARGVFAGVTINGSTIRQDVDANERFYGLRLETRRIVFENAGGAREPVGLWRQTLARYAN